MYKICCKIILIIGLTRTLIDNLEVCMDTSTWLIKRGIRVLQDSYTKGQRGIYKMI